MRALSKMILRGAVAGCLALGVASAAQADTVAGNTIQFNHQGTSDLGGGVYEYSYEVILTGGSLLVADGYATFYDFNEFTGFFDFDIDDDLVTAGVLATDFTVSTQQFGINVPNTAGIPDTSAINFTLTYKGGTSIGDDDITVLGVFKARSTSGVETDAIVASYDQQLSNGEWQSHATDTIGPAAVTAVPVPAAVWGGAALLGALGARRMRKNSK